MLSITFDGFRTLIMLITYRRSGAHLHLARLLRLATTPVRLNATLVSPCLKLPWGDFQQILLAVFATPSLPVNRRTSLRPTRPSAFANPVEAFETDSG